MIETNTFHKENTLFPKFLNIYIIVGGGSTLHCNCQEWLRSTLLTKID
jgi:hypothetical protein